MPSRMSNGHLDIGLLHLLFPLNSPTTGLEIRGIFVATVTMFSFSFATGILMW